jgi:hypothetical protein
LEFLRVRRVFVWYAGIVVAIALLALYGAFIGSHVDFHSYVSNNGNVRDVHTHGFSSVGPMDVPIGPVAGGCGFLALAFATFFAASFNRTSQHAHFAFVRPVSRLRMAVQVAGVDVAAIVVAQLFALAVALSTILVATGVLQALSGFHVPLHLRWDADTLATALLGLGCAVMWYAILQAVTAWTPERRGSGLFLGLGVTVLVLAQPLSHVTYFGPVFSGAFKALLFIDPLAYFSQVKFEDSGDATIGSYFSAAIGVRALIVWAIAAIAIAVASFEWKRVEI